MTGIKKEIGTQDRFTSLLFKDNCQWQFLTEAAVRR